MIQSPSRARARRIQKRKAKAHNTQRKTQANNKTTQLLVIGQAGFWPPDERKGRWIIRVLKHAKNPKPATVFFSIY